MFRQRKPAPPPGEKTKVEDTSTTVVETVSRKRPAPPTAPAETPQPELPTVTAIANSALTPAERAIMRKQKEETHQYGARFQILQTWNLLSRIITQSCANTVVAESAIDLSKWNPTNQNGGQK